MTHCRRIMLEELQRRNFSPTTIRAISTRSSSLPGTSSVGLTGSITRTCAATRRTCCASGSCGRRRSGSTSRRCGSSS